MDIVTLCFLRPKLKPGVQFFLEISACEPQYSILEDGGHVRCAVLGETVDASGE
jgi:hypothetical protein